MFKARAKAKSQSFHLQSNLISFLLGCAFSFIVLSQSPQGACSEVSRIFRTLQQQEVDNLSSLDVSSIPLEKKEESPPKVLPREPKVLSQEPTCSCDSEKGEKSFLKLGQQTSTDKVAALTRLPDCLETGICTRPNCTREECRPWGHFYHTLYQQRMGKYSLESIEPFQFLEIGFYNGNGYDTYRKFLSSSAEVHSMEISCIPEGKREDGKVRDLKICFDVMSVKNIGKAFFRHSAVQIF